MSSAPVTDPDSFRVRQNDRLGGATHEYTLPATWLVSAQALLESAKLENDANPEASYVLAYDTARKAATALVQQGLRTRSAGAPRHGRAGRQRHRTFTSRHNKIARRPSNP